MYCIDKYPLKYKLTTILLLIVVILGFCILLIIYEDIDTIEVDVIVKVNNDDYPDTMHPLLFMVL